MVYSFNFSEEKNQLLQAIRGLSFEDVISAINKGQLLDNIKHPNSKFKHQQIYVVKMDQQVCAVPYVVDLKKKEIFLKTIYPSRVLTKKYLKRKEK